MAGPRLGVEITGDEKDLLRAFKRSSAGASKLDRDLKHVGRGALAGSGAFKGLGRSVAFASGAFLGGAGLTAAISGAFSELNESRKVTAQTNAVLKSTGGIAGVTADQVDALGQSLLRKTGIDDEAIRSTENLLLTFTNLRNVAGKGNDVFNQATAAVLDMSTAMGGDLQGAAVRVGKALQDPVKGVSALRKVGVLLTDEQTKQVKAFVKSGKVMEAQKIILAELTKEFGGSAKAAGDVQPWNLLRETIRNIGADLAEKLLPRIEDVTGRLQKWFDNTSNVNRIMVTSDRIIGAFTKAFKALGDSLRTVDRITGSFENTLEVLLAFAVASKVYAWAASFTALGGAEATAATNAKLLLGRLRLLGAIGVIAIGVELTLHTAGINKALRDKIPGLGAVQDFFNKDPIIRRLNDLGPDVGINGGRKRAGQSTDDARNELRGLNQRNARENAAIAATTKGADAPGNKEIKKAKDLTKNRNQWFDAMIGRREDRVQDIKSLRGEIAELGRISTIVKARLAVTKDITRKLNLEDELVDIGRRQKGLRDEIKANTIAERKLALEKRRAAREKALTALKANTDRQIAKAQTVLGQRRSRQFLALGLTAEGDTRAPGVQNLRAQLGTLTSAVAGTFLDTRKTRSVFARIKTALTGGLGDLGREVRNTISGILSDLDQQLKNHEGAVTKFHKANANAILAGLGLDADTRRELSGRLSRVGAGGLTPARGTGAFGRPITVNTTVTLDGRKVAQSTTKHQQTRARRNPPQKRGVLPHGI